MAKQRNTNQGSAVLPTAGPRVEFVKCDAYVDSVAKYKGNQQVLAAFREFIDFKSREPLALFGGKDRPFTGNGSLRGYIHAGITRDISIIYKISGRDPHVISLYGLYTHNDIGTGTPGRPQLTAKMAAMFNKQQNFRPLSETLSEFTDEDNGLPLLRELLEMTEI